MTRIKKPFTRLVRGGGKTPELVVTLTADYVTIRPKRCTRPGAAISVRWQTVYERALMDRPIQRRRRYRQVSRSMV